MESTMQMLQNILEHCSINRNIFILYVSLYEKVD